MKFKIKISFTIIFALICTLAAGCAESDGSGFVFKYDIPANPRTLDPQTANCRVSALLIANLFDGLLQVENDGRITANVAAEYFISENELTYTFLLRDDVYWYFDGDYSVKCTAYDFVFAFRRLFNPAIKSENAELFYSIKNSRQVHSGEIPYLDAIGVEAFGDFELVITLEEPNPLLPYLLAAPPAMPCNEELFEKTAGRYGLNENSIPSNGAFFITRWNFDPFSHSSENNIIIMRRNEKNSEARRVYPRGLNFFINYDDPLEHFTEGTTHSLVAEGETADMLISRGFPYDGFENSVWGITFNRRGVFRHVDLRLALAAGFDRDEINIGSIGFREAYEINPYLFNLEDARESYERGAVIAGRDNLASLRVIIPVGGESAAFHYLSRILQEWQKNLGFFCRIETFSPDDFDSAFSSGDYDIAMVRFNAEEIPELEQAVFIPICFQTEMFFYDRRAEGLIYNPSAGTVIFRAAKYF
ncbi:MAG: ABC transporter substrate-binding protein [Oscillospiraceae bacterium]|nr:ABC transporter substrate-binding protein [Oscillospiraceae bacterium]